MRCMVK